MKLPAGRGPISEALLRYLRGEIRSPGPVAFGGDALAEDDLQLALFMAHEVHYRGFEEVGDELEWDTALVEFRLALERAMLDRLVMELGPPETIAPAEVPQAIFRIVEEDTGPSLSRFLGLRASREQFCEFVMHRSAYQLKEADPHTFALPRIDGPAKAAMVEIQADEYGGGRFERMHSELFARTMRELGLDASYGAYVDLLPGSTLATVNLITLFGLRRSWRGALVGHLAAFEISSPEPNRRYANGLRRLGYGPRATEFYDEHVEADSVHENIAAYDLAGGLARQHPELAGQIVFGARALVHCERLFADRLLSDWERGESSLLRAKPVAVAA
jgi:hypothetical protein